MLRPAEVREKFGMLPLVLDALRKTNSCVLLRLVNAGSNPKILRSPLKWPFELECIDFLLYTLSEVRVLQSIQKFALGYSIIHLDFPCHRTLRRSPESTKFVPGLHDLLQFQFDFSSDIHRLGQMMARVNGFRFPL